ncbi:DUF748 domain-containing protein [Lutibacter holmesii]|uniref:DUF748 domain-containing protein n=1 Tax=Lutibacter holmesii TaxID=1137985 RepID=A0ABW3WKD1_9FLAO
MKLKKIILITLLSIFTIVVIALLALPTLGKNYVIKHSKELIGRQVEIEKLKINYFTGTAKVLDFKMLEQDEATPFISFDTLIVDLEPYQMLYDEFVLEQFYVKGLYLNAVQKDSVFNFDDLIAFHTSTDTIPKENTTAEPIKYSLSNIEIKGANFYFNNQNIDHTAKINDLSFFVPFIGWDQNNKSEAGIKFNLANNGYFESSVKVDPKSGEYKADLTVHHLVLDPLIKYAQQSVNINYLKGLVNSKLSISGNINQVDNSTVSGNVQVEDFAMNDQQDKKFLAVKKINCVLKEINNAKSSYIIDTLQIKEPYVFFKLDSVSNNFFDIFKITSEEIQEKEEENKTTTQNDSLFYAINHLTVQQGITDYTDNLTGSPFNYHLSDITINSDSILSDADWLTIYSNMLLNKRGTLKAELGLNPLDLNNLNIDISIEKFKLPDINIYTGYYMGHTILEGDMYYYSNSKVINGQITSENKLLIKNPSLNSTQKGLYNLPLKFALFILTDKNGEVNLDIPVRGDLNDPSLDIKTIVWSTFKNLIVKVAASPGKLLAGLFGGDPKDFEAIHFNYLDSIPSDQHIKQLNMLLDLEDKKPELKIDLVHYVDPELQKEAIAKAEVGKLYFKKKKKDYLKDEKGFEHFVRKKIAQDTLSINKACLALTTPTVIDSIVALTNKTLLTNVEKYLKTTKDSTQINIETASKEAPENLGTKPMLKVNFSMKEE